MKKWTKEEMLTEVSNRSILMEGREMVSSDSLKEIYEDSRFPEEYSDMMKQILKAVKKLKKEIKNGK